MILFIRDAKHDMQHQVHRTVLERNKTIKTQPYKASITTTDFQNPVTNLDLAKQDRHYTRIYEILALCVAFNKSLFAKYLHTFRHSKGKKMFCPVIQPCPNCLKQRGQRLLNFEESSNNCSNILKRINGQDYKAYKSYIKIK